MTFTAIAPSRPGESDPRARLEITDQDRRELAHHVLFDRRHRFVLFTIPKVACTPWIRLFLRFVGVDDRSVLPHHAPERPLLSSLEPGEIARILEDPSWTRACFLRDPAERLLSAYLNKVRVATYVTQKLFDGRADVSFDEFLDVALDRRGIGDRRVAGGQHRGLHASTDPHWRPQHLVGGLARFMPHVDFVGAFETLRADGRRLLERVGAWDRYGCTGWGRDGSREFLEETDGNRSGASARFRDFYDEETLRTVREAYAEDYAFLARWRRAPTSPPATRPTAS